MINASPAQNHNNNNSLPSMPNAGGTEGAANTNTTSPNQQQPDSQPFVAPTQVQTPTDSNTAVKPHGDVSHLSQDLSKKIHGGDVSVSAAPTDSVPPAPDKSIDSNNKPPKKPFKFNGKGLIAALILGLVVAGGGAGYYLTQQNQDTRQQAASEEVTNTESSRTQTEWGMFNQQWNEVLSGNDKDWIDFVNYAQSAGARYDCEAPIMTVGEETLYGCDLNALFILYEPEAYIQPGPISPQDETLNSVLDGLITNSGLLQEAQDRGLITLQSNIYNSPTKDTITRLNTLRELRDEVGLDINKTVDFEVITIYFHNQIDPEIPLAEAQAAAKAKMDVLYNRLQSGELTMEQAGAEIAADNIQGDTTGVSLSQLDPVYPENAYVVLKSHIFDSGFFKDTSLDDELRSLGEGQISTVKLCRDYKFTDQEMFDALEAGEEFNPPMVDSCYMIFKVNKINFGWTDEQSTSSSGEQSVETKYKADTTKNLENLQ